MAASNHNTAHLRWARLRDQHGFCLWWQSTAWCLDLGRRLRLCAGRHSRTCASIWRESRRQACAMRGARTAVRTGSRSAFWRPNLSAEVCNRFLCRRRRGQSSSRNHGRNLARPGRSHAIAAARRLGAWSGLFRNGLRRGGEAAWLALPRGCRRRATCPKAAMQGAQDAAAARELAPGKRAHGESPAVGVPGGCARRTAVAEPTAGAGSAAATGLHAAAESAGGCKVAPFQAPSRLSKAAFYRSASLYALVAAPACRQCASTDNRTLRGGLQRSRGERHGSTRRRGHSG